MRLDTSSPRFNESEQSVTFTPNDIWSLRLGHHYVRSVPGAGDDSGYEIYYGTIFYRFDQNWAVRLTGLHQEQHGNYNEAYFSLYRDFRSWVGALTLRVRDDATGDPEYTVAFTISLKAFPRFRTGQDATNPTLLLGG